MHVFLDTDIGTDVDDALALGLLLGSPEVSLDGVSTVYGDTVLRARLASRLAVLSARGRAFPIAAGEQETRSGREVWWAGHEGSQFDDLDAEPVDDAGGVDLLIRTVDRHPGDIDILAIGPLTNIAAALDRDPGFARKARRLVVMGGDFRIHDRVNEHNFKSDVAAAQRVFTSELNIIVGGLDLTQQARLQSAELERIGAAGLLGAALAQETKGWWTYINEGRWNNPHDPILALWLLQPELFETTQQAVTIDDEGYTDIVDGGKKVTIVRELDQPLVTEAIVSRVVSAGVGT